MIRRPAILTITMLALPALAAAQIPAPPAPAVQGITFAQFAARRGARLMAMDADGDGRVSRGEYLAGARAGHGDPARRFARLDRNGDGFVDRGEIDAALRRRFARLDRDRDGVLTPAERVPAPHARQE